MCIYIYACFVKSLYGPKASAKSSVAVGTDFVWIWTNNVYSILYERKKGCFDPHFFQSLPDFNHLTNLNKLCLYQRLHVSVFCFTPRHQRVKVWNIKVWKTKLGNVASKLGHRIQITNKLPRIFLAIINFLSKSWFRAHCVGLIFKY